MWTHFVDVFLAAVFVKSNRPRNDPLREGGANCPDYKNFPLSVVERAFNAMPSTSGKNA
jgi:hypothetical protein